MSWRTIFNWFGTGQIVQVESDVIPSGVDVCVAVPLVVTINSWPKNKGKGRTGGGWTSSQTLTTANFLWNPQRFEAIDTRGCMITIVR